MLLLYQAPTNRLLLCPSWFQRWHQRSEPKGAAASLLTRRRLRRNPNNTIEGLPWGVFIYSLYSSLLSRPARIN